MNVVPWELWIFVSENICIQNVGFDFLQSVVQKSINQLVRYFSYDVFWIRALRPLRALWARRNPKEKQIKTIRNHTKNMGKAKETIGNHSKGNHRKSIGRPQEHHKKSHENNWETMGKLQKHLTTLQKSIGKPKGNHQTPIGNHRKTIGIPSGKPEENQRNTLRKPWANHWKTIGRV